LPSVRELAMITKVNPNTMQKALTELENDGFIFTERTNGKFVTEDKNLISELKEKMAQKIIGNYFKDMEKIGINQEDALRKLKEQKEEK
jgi:DNA-binding transcriptional regulator YhcF (GntR family)